MTPAHSDDDGPADRLRRAVAYALTGAEASIAPSTEPFDPAELITRLGGVDALRAVAEEARTSGLAWPYPIPERLRDDIGAAQLHAAVERARQLIEQPRPTLRQRSTAPDADDLRLIREVPPHHGH